MSISTNINEDEDYIGIKKNGVPIYVLAISNLELRSKYKDDLESQDNCRILMDWGPTVFKLKPWIYTVLSSDDQKTLDEYTQYYF